jgi:hypothetical protein
MERKQKTNCHLGQVEETVKFILTNITVPYLLKERSVKPVETAVAREQL